MLAVLFAVMYQTLAVAGQPGLSYSDSIALFPEEKKASAGAPNVVLILLDDVGFADAAPFGGSIQTQTLDKLAKGGISFTGFHTTGLCSPTRAALLTGRNHHDSGFGSVSG